ncbi:hypothetical protein QC763_0095530 [Podospora pseudopauciseta]|uniref:Rhodopsin domain-containing protein n=1 Tax=Podospora pseudopauciseta TaxID=2093780 RepID=A0ABR0H5L3_9PEZI|nr:hypothetical protein QC763_0095530 [Podospora pseudopauciseta]
MTTLQHATTGNLNGNRPPSPSGQVENLEPVILGTGAALMPITVAIAMVRIATGRAVSKLHVDDFAQLGVARHAWDIPLTSINPQVYQVWAAHTVLGIISFFNTKALILTFYLRLFGTVRWVRWMCYSLLSLSVVIYGMIGLWYVAGCVPKSSKLPVCDETGPLILAGGVFTVVADVMLFGMPFPVIRGLRLGRDKKRGLVVLFGFAILIIATSTVSLAYRISIVVNGTEDPSWDGAEVAVTAYVEIFGTVIVASAPALYTFWTRIFTETRLYATLRSGFWCKQRTEPDIRLGQWKTWPAAHGVAAVPVRAKVVGTESSQDLIQEHGGNGGILKTVTVTREVVGD